MHLRLNSVPIFLALFVATALAACGDVGDAPQAQTGIAVEVSRSAGEVLVVDTSQSEIRWRAAKVTRAHDGGFRSFSGRASVDDRGNLNGLEINIDTRSIWSDTERLTGHLKNEDFFDVERHPSASFRSDDIAPINSSGFTHLVTGNLAMHGQVRSITFPAKVASSADAVHAIGDFIIDRRQWGVSYSGKPDDLIENDVRILFDVTARRGEELSGIRAE